VFTMTVFLPLQEGATTPPFPSFLCPASEPTDYWKRVIKAILKAKHIAVVCGEHLETTLRRTQRAWVDGILMPGCVAGFRGRDIRSSWNTRFSFIQWPVSKLEEG